MTEQSNGTAEAKSVFGRALQIDSAAERAAYLDEACGENNALRAEVEQLLEAHEQAGSFLNHPPAAEMPTLIAEPMTEGPGTVIGGRYKLLQEIGEGGMGVVYMAEQTEPIRRKVALKIIKPGMDTTQVVARFEAERQALALMEHQNIARVLDAGTTGSVGQAFQPDRSGTAQEAGRPGKANVQGAPLDTSQPGKADVRVGRPYFVMELVKGAPITHYCDRNRLTLRERLELFAPVCHAIQHAHQKGIIHRDIKPSNVLVCLYDGRPVPKVIDFGVAKAIQQPLVQQTLFTQFGQIVGTLEYMSPEQAELNQLDVDTRSDVYSLGVLLYELLTGTTPITHDELARTGFPAALMKICEQEPETPSLRLGHSDDTLPEISAQRRVEPQKLPGLVRGELDWIVMKALEKDRTRRYATAADLARDVQRHLEDEPVEACPASVAYKLRKWARKHRASLTVAASFVLLLLAGAAVSTWQAVRATRAERQATAERDRAFAAEQQAKSERDTAETAQLQAQDALGCSLYQQAQVLTTSQLPDRRSRQLDLLAEAEKLRARTRTVGADAKTELPAFRLLPHFPTQSDLRTLAIGALSTPGGHVVSEVATRLTGTYSNVVISADGRFAAAPSAAGRNRGVRLFDLRQGKIIREMTMYLASGKSPVALSPDGKWLAAITHKLTGPQLKPTLQGLQLELWQLPNGNKPAKVIAWPRDKSSEKIMVGGQTHLVFGPKGRRLAASKRGRNGIEYVLWELDTGDARILTRVPVTPQAQALDLLSSGLPPFVSPAPSFSSTGDKLAYQVAKDEFRVERFTTPASSTDIKLPYHAAGPISISPDDRFAAVPCWDTGKSTVLIWEIEARADQSRLPVNSPVSAVAFSPSGDRVVVGDGTDIVVFDRSQARQLLRLRSAQQTELTQLFWPAANELISVDRNGLLKRWELAFETPVSLIATPGGERVTSAAFSRDGKWLALVQLNQARERLTPTTKVRLIDRTNGQVRQTFDAFGYVSFSPDSQCLAILDLRDTRQARKVVDMIRAEEFKKQAKQALDAHFPTLAANARIWDVKTGQKVAECKARDECKWWSGSFNEQNQFVVLEQQEQQRSELRGRDVATDNVLWSMTVPEAESSSSFELLDNANIVATHFQLSRSTLRRFPEGEKLANFELPPQSPGFSVVLSQDKRWAAQGFVGKQPGTASVHVFDVISGSKKLEIPCLSHSYQFSPEGQLLAVAHSSGWEVWDVAGGRELFHSGRIPPDQEHQPLVAFTPDGRSLVTFEPMRQIRLIDLTRVRHQLGPIGLGW